MAKDKISPVGRHIARQEPDFIVQPPAPLPEEIPHGRQPIHRLSMRLEGPRPTTPDQLARQILSSPPHAVFFVDANVFFNELHHETWNALIQRKVAVTPQIFRELQQSWCRTPSANRHIHHLVMEWIERKHSPVFEYFHLDPENKIIASWFAYYMHLLVARKRLWGIVEDQLYQQLHRHPTEQEVQQHLFKHYGERGYLRAKKGKNANNSRTFSADEEMVLLAFVHALCFGTETVILSGDKDVEDQVYKLQWLLNTHYRGMLFAECWSRGDITLPTTHLDTTDPEIAKAFFGDDAVLLQGRSASLEEVLPETCTQSILYNWLVTGPLSEMRFHPMAICLEQEMRRLLWMKATTNGSNTNVLDGRNCHIWQRPLPIPNGCVVFARDIKCRLGGTEVPILDLQHAFGTDERIGLIECNWAGPEQCEP